ncbi:MAG TPA: T9SS type A sorting domain-containing protein [Bacteroidia bacterium]|nr:T9SS type A sorting domain-containing protein [Bacteroidia bacterium]
MRLIYRVSVIVLTFLFSSNISTAQVAIYQTIPQSGTSNASWSLDNEGNSTEVLVIVHYTGFSSVSATYNSNSSHQVSTISDNGDKIALFTFNELSTGSHVVALTVSGSGSYYAEAIALQNVDDDNSVSISTISSSSGTTASITDNGADEKDMLIGGVFGDLGTISSGTIAASAQKDLEPAFSSPYIGKDAYAMASSTNKLTFSFSKSSSNSIWITHISGTIALPINLLSFGAQYLASSNSIAINWSTATEVNNKSFTIEKTADGVNYTTVTDVAGAGNSVSTLYYTAMDEQPWGGTSYYRLKQTDFDGTYTYSPTVAVTAPVTTAVSIYPNPVTDHTTISYNADSPAPVFVRIFNMAGMEVNSYNFNAVQTGGNNFTINTAFLPQGMYIMEVTDGSKTINHKFTRQ